MTQEVITEQAKTMFLNNSGRKEVIAFLLKNGVSEQDVEKVATDAFLAIKEQRKELLEEKEVEVKKAMSKSLIIGGIVLLGGIIATMTTNRIWYGAIGIGLIMMVNGVRK